MNEFVPEGWSVEKLDSITKVIDSAHQTPIFSLSGFPMVRVGDIKGGRISLVGTVSVSSDVFDIFTKNYQPKYNDILMTRVGSYGRSSIVKTNKVFCLGQNTVVVNPKSIDADYLYQLLQGQNVKNQIEDTVGGSSQKSLSLGAIKSLKILTPVFPEQQKIAAILTSVDEVIEKTQAQINKLKDLKTGMMQELLTRGVGVDGKPHTEFKDSPVGRIPKGWEVVKLDNVATIQTGAAKSSKLTGDLIELPYLRVANVQDGYLNLAEIKKIMIPRNKSERFLLQNNDVLVNEGGDFDKLGRGSIWHSQITPCAHQNHVFVVRTDSKKLSPMFFNHISGSEYGKKYYMGCAKQTTNLASINSTQLKQFPVLLPSLEEQDSICEVLDSVDQTIAKNQVKLAQNRNLKKALMQDLLTGKVRVKVDIE